MNFGTCLISNYSTRVHLQYILSLFLLITHILASLLLLHVWLPVQCYRRRQNRVTDSKREGEGPGIAAAGELMLLLWDMKKGRAVQITAKMDTFYTLILVI